MPRLGQLAVNDEGFIFDPTTGESFTCNQPGLAVLRGLKQGKSVQDIVAVLAEEFEVEAKDAERDVFDFIDHLRVFKIVQ
ncbi:Coenzyme PQQ synthesis protein D (PqqD) [uncultured Gammaproteobacteria bacterium]